MLKLKNFTIWYFGLFLSLLNKFFLRRNPKKKEIKFWDNIIVPLSIISDF